jgi:hypothetical protein
MALSGEVLPLSENQKGQIADSHELIRWEYFTLTHNIKALPLAS